MQLEPLSRERHGALRVDPLRAMASAAEVHLVPVVLDEIRRIASAFPVVLAKDPDTGEFYPAALMGLAPGENLYWDGEHFAAHTVPMNLLRLPFFLRDTSAGEGAIHVDRSSPAIVAEGGQAILAADGGDSPYFQSVQATLQHLVAQRGPTRAFVDWAVAAKLVCEVNLDIVFDDSSAVQLSGLYGIDERALQRGITDGPTWGNTLAAAAMLLSLEHIPALVRRKNLRIAQDAAWHRVQA